MRAFQEELQLCWGQKLSEALFLFHLCCSPGEEQLQCPVLELCNSSGEPTAPILWEPAPRGAAPFLHLSDAPGIHSKAPLLLCLGFVQRALPGTE